MSQSTPTDGLAGRVETTPELGGRNRRSGPEPETSAVPSEPVGCLATNLAALRRSQPAIAVLVEQSDIPNSVKLTQGRDASWTYLLPGENDRREWLGRSSMPSVSAEALYGDCTYDGSNIALPGIMTGVELLVLARRLPPQCAIFVVEADSLRLRLAMQMHDYSELIDAGRVVFLDAHGLPAAMAEFFTDHPGYELPRTLFTGALRAPAKVAELQRRFEFAGEAALQAQGAALVDAVERIHRRTLEVVPSVPRVALVSVDQRLGALEQGRRLARGLAAMNAKHAVCLPDAPRRCHVVAGLRAVESIDANLVLSVNVSAERWRALLPERIPIGAILLGVEAAPTAVIETLTSRDLVFAASAAVEQEVLGHGLPRQQCLRFDPAADDVLLQADTGVRTDGAEPEFDAMIVADVPDDRAEANDVTLASHIALWSALLSVAERYARGIGAPDADSAKELLRLAERDCNVRIDGDELRRFFEDATRRRIVPAAFARAALASVSDGRTRAALCGANWDSSRSAAARLGGLPPVSEIAGLARRAGILVFPIPDRTNVQFALDAAAAGANVLLRTGDLPFRAEYPQLASIAPLLSTYRNGDDLRRAVRSPRRPAATQPSALREALASGHTVSRRIQWMIDQLQNRQECVPCGPS